ncbi:MAG: protoheme IX farnesyltransferase [Candidatus Omnitrophica bacterium]|nr:protoheme IX farnesyltransferase [Candidatus Omnitrophota bacterium]
MRPFAFITAVLSFLLIVAGGLVTSTDSGLSVPDWPLSYGKLFPPMVGGIRFEHTHRMIASAVGLMTLLLTVWILLRETRRGIRRLCLFALGLVAFQGILGGLTVLWQLPPLLSIAHACMGQTFFAVMVVLVDLLRGKTLQGLTPSGFWLSTSATLAITLQLILGAALRHTGAGLPLHLFWAVVVTLLVCLWAGKLWKEQPRAALWMGGLMVLQLALGGLTFFARNTVLLPTAHVAVGALLLATSSLLSARLAKSVKGPDVRVYLELTKPRLTGLALITVLIGFLLGSRGPLDPLKLFLTLLGTGLVGSGAGALNQYLEREADARMKRTSGRPLPSGRLTPQEVLPFGVLLSSSGLLTLSWGSHPLAGGLSAITLAVYLFLYTPLKTRSGLCTLIGAVPGAIPPLIGWAAARGKLGLEAWLLFAILFLWQLPHFLAIAWLYREDYTRAGFRMLTVLDPKGDLAFRQIILYLAALLPVSLLPSLCGMSGGFYFLAALTSGTLFLGVGLFTARSRSGEAARRLFAVSVAYLPFLLLTMTLDRVL